VPPLIAVTPARRMACSVDPFVRAPELV
jgi:hypothetical protein